jgi:hypothetical protein
MFTFPWWMFLSERSDLLIQIIPRSFLLQKAAGAENPPALLCGAPCLSNNLDDLQKAMNF